MIIVDTALKRRAAQGNPVRVAMAGAGFMGRGLANQILNSVPGMRLVAIYARDVTAARRAYSEAGAESRVVTTVGELEAAIRDDRYAITDDPSLLPSCGGIDCLLDATGAVEFGASFTLDAIRNRKHIVTLNAELDGTVGPILKHRAEQNGVIFSGADGDQPGVEMNLYRFVKSIGLAPLVCGNIKGLQDPYRNPTTQKGFAEKWGQRPEMVTSFADGTKISFEQAIVANATGMTVARRGMSNGMEWKQPIDTLTSQYDVEQLREMGGIVDYVVGATPGPGVFVFATHDDPKQRHFLNLYKLGEGPLYSFYVPYHLCHFEVPLSVARVVLFDDPVLQPIAGPRVDVVATAKTDLRAGTTLDGLGGYHTYGQAERSETTFAQRLLPMGLAEGCTLLRDVSKDEVLSYADVQRPAGRIADALRAEQDEMFWGSARAEPETSHKVVVEVSSVLGRKTAPAPAPLASAPVARRTASSSSSPE